MASPLDTHWHTVKRIIRYLSGTLEHGLLLSPSLSAQKFSLRAYSDSDRASDPDDRRSTSGIPFYTPILLCDNLSVAILLHNLVLHARTKHIELYIHFIRERVVAKKLQTRPVPATTQIANTLIKPLGSTMFVKWRSKLKVQCEAHSL
ncbi:hypothetical protein KIW84_074308 [Lathyrus oleraceus]|uniref:Uncharacterized protein n=1 Tax=Pisum sativum TaxID=3888 RepID=A0A9D4ZYE2_PEA|nr:hypothetical protein KIW84_074308 [Pisum sativum]